MEKKYKIFFASIILVALLSAGKVAADLVTSASNISLTSNKTSKTNVKEALDELYGNVGKCPAGKECYATGTLDAAKAECPSGKICNNPKCKRATTLHNNTKTGGKFGNLGTTGTLASGDAFTCDVNGDGTYDETTERFYYVSDLWEGGHNMTYHSNYAVLIYYSNIKASVNNIIPDNSYGKAYDISGKNYRGPVEVLGNIPSITHWKNVSLRSQTRPLYNESNRNTYGEITLPSYTYANKVARLLTTQEINIACNIKVGNSTAGELDTCTYLMENTRYENTSNKYGYWLETPYSFDLANVWCVSGGGRFVNYYTANSTDDFGVRPAIEVLKSDILY